MYVFISGKELPFTSPPKWWYKVSVQDSSFTDSFVSTVKLTAQEMLDVQSYYAESLNDYLANREKDRPWVEGPM